MANLEDGAASLLDRVRGTARMRHNSLGPVAPDGYPAKRIRPASNERSAQSTVELCSGAPCHAAHRPFPMLQRVRRPNVLGPTEHATVNGRGASTVSWPVQCAVVVPLTGKPTALPPACGCNVRVSPQLHGWYRNSLLMPAPRQAPTRTPTRTLRPTCLYAAHCLTARLLRLLTATSTAWQSDAALGGNGKRRGHVHFKKGRDRGTRERQGEERGE